MSANFSNLKLINIIVHDVYKPNGNDTHGSTNTTDYLIKLDVAAKEELSKRIVNVLGKESKSREMDIIEGDHTSCCYFSEQIIQINSEESFIKYSQEIAKKHARIHTSRNWPDGILVIIQATISSANTPCLFIIKAEEQSGFLRDNTAQKGNSFQFLTSLFLTPQSRLYKIGVFIPERSENKAILFDDTQSNTKEPAKYFYWSFLGLGIPQTGKQYTKEFFEHTSKFIEELPDATDEEKISYQQALYT